MLRHTVQFQRELIKQEEEKNRQEEEINEICQDIRIVEQKIRDLEVEIDKLKNSLPLKKMIKGFYKIKGKTPEEINILNALLVKHKEQKSALALDENASQTVLNVNTIKPLMALMPQVSSDTSEQIVDGSSLLQQIQRVQLKQVDKNTDKNTLASPENTDSAPSKFLLDLKYALSTNKLKGAVNTVVSDKNKSNLSEELEEKFALLQKRKEEKNNPTMNSVTTKKSLSESDEVLKQIIPVLGQATPLYIPPEIFNEGSDANSDEDIDEFTFLEKVCNTRRFFGSLQDISQPINRLSKISEVQSRPNSMMNMVDESNTNSMSCIDEDQTGLNSAVDEFNEVAQSPQVEIPILDKETKKPKVLSMHFNSSNQDGLVIVGEIPKLKV